MIDLREKPPKILVIGDLMIDHYLWGDCERISPEAPVQIVNISRENLVLGGAGNVVNNLKALGAEVEVMSVIGSGQISTELKTLLADIGVSTRYLLNEAGRITTKKSRVIASGQQVVRYDLESSSDISDASQSTIITTLKKIIKDYQVVLVSDYGKGVLTATLMPQLIALADEYNKKILIDPKGTNYTKYKGAYLLTPNKKEAALATQIEIKDNNNLIQALQYLKTRYNLKLAMITLGEQGVAIYDGRFKIYPTVAQEVFDVTGAGDTMLAALGFALAAKMDIDQALEFANLAAGVVVGKIGSATVTLDEIYQYESSIHHSNSQTHIKTASEIYRLAKVLKTNHKKIIFTNGCFDLLHIGHIKYLETAKSLGDILIVGLNSDTSIASLKGKNRPINTQKDRAYVLAGLEVVDYVVIFDEPTPYELIKNIRPDILVKGDDYKGKTVVGQEIVDELKLVPFIKGKSTSKIIEKIQEKK